MSKDTNDTTVDRTLRYRLCPKCARAVPASSGERYCINDGTHMLERCPVCDTSIGSPHARFCGACGLEFTTVEVAAEK